MLDAGERWWVGRSDEAGQALGYVSVLDAALAQEAVTAIWRVVDGISYGQGAMAAAR